MSEPEASPSGRSGCALVLGVLLIATGVLFLAQNLFGYSLFRFFRVAVAAFAAYWPVLLVIWGLVKVYQRFSDPSRARASGFEVVLLILVIVSGLTLRAARRVMNEVSNEMSFEDIAELAGVPALGAPGHRFPQEERFVLGPGDRVSVVSPGGSVKISGKAPEAGDGGSSMEVTAMKRVHHRSESEASRIAEAVEIEFSESASGPRLEVVLPEKRARIEVDLEIRLPRTAGVSVENRRGRVEVFDLSGPVAVETSRDGIEARNLAGGLRAETRHGDIRVADIAGDVELVTRGGSIAAGRIQGELRATASHGRIRAEEVSGRALLANRHAEIRASRIQGPLEVNAVHSDVSVENAGASVAIENSHAPVFVRDVSGTLTLKTRNCAIQARDVRGEVSLEGEGDPVTLVGVGGAARLRALRSRVTVEEIEGPLEIESSHDDVRVRDFGSSLQVRSSHARLRVETARLSGGVSLETTYGDVRLRLPAGTPLSFQGRAESGALRSTLPGLDLREEAGAGARSFSGLVGGGGPQVSVTTKFGDIVLEPVEP